MAGEAQVVETLGVLKCAGSTQGRHKPAVVVLRGHAGPWFWQQQSLCWEEGEGLRGSPGAAAQKARPPLLEPAAGPILPCTGSESPLSPPWPVRPPPHLQAELPPWGDLLRAFFSNGQSPLLWGERPSLLPDRSPVGEGRVSPFTHLQAWRGWKAGRSRGQEGPSPGLSPSQPQLSPVSNPSWPSCPWIPDNSKPFAVQGPRPSAKGHVARVWRGQGTVLILDFGVCMYVMKDLWQ